MSLSFLKEPLSLAVVIWAIHYSPAVVQVLCQHQGFVLP
jgi:hypothetical protein